MRKSAVVLMCLFISGTAQASERDPEAGATEIPCHPLVTRAECRDHHDLLARLPEGPERGRYLDQYLLLLEDRVKACRCHVAGNGTEARRVP
jgi:hypothetical protein